MQIHFTDMLLLLLVVFISRSSITREVIFFSCFGDLQCESQKDNAPLDKSSCAKNWLGFLKEDKQANCQLDFMIQFFIIYNRLNTDKQTSQ